MTETKTPKVTAYTIIHDLVKATPFKIKHIKIEIADVAAINKISLELNVNDERSK